MPIADITGAASNAINAARSQMAVNLQQKQALLGGIQGLADTASEAMYQKKMRDELVKAGLSPELARDPHTAATALLQRQKENLQRSDASKQVGAVNQMFPGANVPTDAGFDASTAYTIASQQAAEARRKKEREALSSAWAPQDTTIPLPGIAGAPSSMSVPMKPTPMQGYERAVRGGADPQSALNIAKGFDELTPKPVAQKPWQPMTEDDQIAHARRMAEAGRAPEKTTAQIAAEAKARAEGEAAAGNETPEQKLARLEAEAKARAKGTAEGGGTPIENQITALELAIKSMQVSEHESPELKRAIDAVAEAKKNLREFKDQAAANLFTSKSKVAAREAELAAEVKTAEDAAKAAGAVPQKGTAPPPPPTTAVNPKLKAEFDSFPPERQAALLAKMSPEEKAKIGR